MKHTLVALSLLALAAAGCDSASQTTSPAQAKAVVEACLKEKGVRVTDDPSGVTQTIYGALDAEFKRGKVIFLFSGSSFEAEGVAKAEVEVANAFGFDGSDLVKQDGDVTYFWQTSFRHDQQTINNCLAKI